MNEAVTKTEVSRSGINIGPIDKALDKIVAGVCIITTAWRKKPYGMTASWVARASNNPYMVSISVWRQNYTHHILMRSKVFSLNVLNENGKEISLLFGRKSGRDVDKFENVPYFLGENGCPILVKYTTSYLECKVADILDAGDHTLFLGLVLSGAVVAEANPLVFRREQYL